MPARSISRILVAAMAALSVSLLTEGSAKANTLQPALVDAERFRPAVDGNAGFATSDTSVPALGEFAVGLTLHNAFHPVVLLRENGARDSLVSNRLTGVVTGLVGVGGPVAIGVSIPVTLFQSGSLSSLPHSIRPGGSSQLGVAGFGDLLLSPRVALLQEERHGVDLSLDGSLTLPTGSSNAFQGDGALGGLVSATLGRTFDSTRLLLLVGARFRPSNELLTLQVGNELAVRFAAIQRLPVGEVAWIPRELIGEIDLSTLLLRPFEPLTSPGEWRIGARLCPISNLAVTVGAGGGLTPAYGTPFARALVSVGWDSRTCAVVSSDQPAPAPAAEPDADDGVAEQAGLDAERKDDFDVPFLHPGDEAAWFDDEDCAETGLCAAPADLDATDSDGDGIPDADDACPEVPGLAEFEGCPDPAIHDTDGDGIVDADDACPLIPGPVAYGGCPAPDRDGDGVPDDQDLCPDEAGPAQTGGCPPRPGDRDGDGIDDTHDRCPLQAGVAEAFGCPMLDSDDDGIPDHEDNCPSVPGTIENRGCTSPQLVFLAGNQIDFDKPITFRQDTAELTPASKAIIDNLAQVLNSHPEFPRVRIEGHLDNSGEPEETLVLSQARAESVVAALVERGVALERLVAKGLGADKPIASNATPRGRRANQRIEAWIVGRPSGWELEEPVADGMDEPFPDFLDFDIHPIVPLQPAGSSANEGDDGVIDGQEREDVEPGHNFGNENAAIEKRDVEMDGEAAGARGWIDSSPSVVPALPDEVPSERASADDSLPGMTADATGDSSAPDDSAPADSAEDLEDDSFDPLFDFADIPLFPLDPVSPDD